MISAIALLTDHEVHQIYTYNRRHPWLTNVAADVDWASIAGRLVWYYILVPKLVRD